VTVATTTLDDRYPRLSKLVREGQVEQTLELLASRAPAVDYEYFDLERLLAQDRAIENAQIDEISAAIVAAHHEQTRGYLATIEQFVTLFPPSHVPSFVRRKLLAPRVARSAATSTEMLDTLAECSWGLWLHDRYGNLEIEKTFPSGIGDADFFTKAPSGELWIDCVSPKPKERPESIECFIADEATEKWKSKFGAPKRNAASLPSAIAITLLKGQEHLMPKLVFDEIVGRAYVAPPDLWSRCPGLEHVWCGLQSWGRTAQRPSIVAEWKR
jgi:hypothetical protein